MRLHTITRCLLISAAFLVGLFSSSSARSPAELTVRSIAEATQSAHNLESWWTKEVVQVDMTVDFGGQKIVDGTFTFEAHGPRARYDRKDGVSIIYDGSTAWVTPADAEAAMGHFHVLTWPWFVMAPFKMQGEGIQLSEPSLRPMNGEIHKSLLQTFDDEMGDTPDDWYRFFIDPETHWIEGMSYIVTYATDTEAANEKPSIILYHDYTGGDGPRIAQSYEFYYWDPQSGTTVGEQPKGTGTVSRITYLDSGSEEANFTVPAEARELKLPAQPIDYSDYARLLDTYVTRTGVRYAAWFENQADRQALSDFFEYASGIELDGRSDAEQAAFYINLYNAAMLEAVFDHYPLDSVKDIGLFPFSIFKKDFIRQNGRTLSLDGIEKEILLEDHFDPRIHFAVNCASESCPPLLDEPYLGQRLDAQLDAQTRAFANSARAARVLTAKEQVAYSEIFKWYEDDFGVRNPAEYLNRYREMPLPLDYGVVWIDYDWSLNVAE